MNKKTVGGIILFVFIVVTLFVVFLLQPDYGMIKDLVTGRNTISQQTPSTQPAAKRTRIKVYYPNMNNAASKTKCDVTAEVARSVVVTPHMADTALRVLFAGPTKSEKGTGLISPFIPSASMGTSTMPLSVYYVGVTITNGVATVKFRKNALHYLNASACIQQSVKTPIEQTLKQFPAIKEVEYSIDGKVFIEWDA